MKNFFVYILLSVCTTMAYGQQMKPVVSSTEMERVYNEIKTPYKYGLVLVPEDGSKMVDSPSIFRENDKWYMIYVVFNGKGYETWIAQSNDLLHWNTKGRILSPTKNTWDATQKAGYISLQDYTWGGSYQVEKYDDKYWMSYIGGATEGYEQGVLGVGIAFSKNLTEPKEWSRVQKPVMLPGDDNAKWYDNGIIYKSSIIHDKTNSTGHPFVMFYNAHGKDDVPEGMKNVERIAVAVSDDMTNWSRYGDEPVLNHHTGITGDAFITKIDDLWVMFYFGAFWKPKAFERFACSYDLINWTPWLGPDLVAPSEPYDSMYAHKPFVIKHNGIVYHFYNSVGPDDHDRAIAVATSVDMGKSTLKFPKR